MKLYVTYCARTKVQRGKPRQLYGGQRIKSFFNRFPSPRAILSHKHGIVLENEIVDQYDVKQFENIEELAKKVKRVVNGNLVIFYSPRELTEKQWIDFLDLSEVKYKVIRSYKELRPKSSNLNALLE